MPGKGRGGRAWMGLVAAAHLVVLVLPCTAAAAAAPAGAGDPAATAAAVHPVAEEPAADPATVPGDAGRATRPVRLRLGRLGHLRIGALPEFDYDGRLGGGLGTIADLGAGRWSVTFPAADLRVPPLPMVPGRPDLPLRVNITAGTMAGTLDVCTGALSLDFDARFQPEAFGTLPPALSVVTPLTTGRVTASGRTLVGSPLDAFGRSTLVGVAPVPRTGDVLVDALLGLPAPASAQLVAELDVAGGLPSCPGAPRPAPQVRIEIGPRSLLSIGVRGPFAYDGGSVATWAPLTERGAGRYGVAVDLPGTVAPPLLPPPWMVGLVVEPRALSGEVDVCSGSVGLDVEARVRTWVFGTVGAPVPVGAHLSTGPGPAGGMLGDGVPLDPFGSLRLVGAASVPRSGDWFGDLLLGLPATAGASLDANLDLLGVRCPG